MNNYMSGIIKIVAVIIVILVVVFVFTSCGNKDVFDTVRKYDYAIIEFPYGTVETIYIQKWRDYDGEQIQIIAKDGTVYLVNSANCVLVRK